MEENKKFMYIDENQKWLINRLDTWRNSISTRSALVISASAILIATYVILLQKVLDLNSFILSKIALGSIFISILLVVISIYYATTSIANIWKPSKDIFNFKLPNRLLFHPSDITKDISEYFELKNKHIKMTQNDYEDAFWAEITSLVYMHDYRYKCLKKSIYYLVFSLPIFLLAIILFLYCKLM